MIDVATARKTYRVAVVGLGVLGLGAVALGPLFGARTVSIGNSPVRLEMAASVGAHAGFLYNDLDLVNRLEEIPQRGTPS